MAQTTIDSNEKRWLKKSCRCLQKFWFCSHFLQTDDFSTNCWKTFKYSKKESRFFYMAGREVEIHRGRLDKKILADRAQLFPRFLSKKIYKNFKKIEKHFHFFGLKIWNFLKNLDFFHFRRKNRESFSKDRKRKKSRFFRDFSKFFKISIQKNENAFRDFLKFFKNLFWYFFLQKLRTVSENLFIQYPAMNFHLSARHIEKTTLFFRIFKGYLKDI